MGKKLFTILGSKNSFIINYAREPPCELNHVYMCFNNSRLNGKE